MQAWQIASPPSSAPAGLGPWGAHRLVEPIGEPGFAGATLAALNEVVQAASWAVYQVWPRPGRGRPPELHLSASLGVADTTGECFQAYREQLHQRDCSFDPVRRQQRPGHAVVLRMRAEEAPNDDHREIIYRRHGVLERLSVAHWDGADQSLLAVNLYHHAHQGAFTGLEMERFSQLAPLLLACVRRHVALTNRLARPAQSDRERLRQRCPALTERELDVCERLLRGWSYDGIAADMQLGVATVKTYRARAFDRLGLHFRSELFALTREPSG